MTTPTSQHLHAHWRLSLLIPSWTLQLALLLGIMGIFSYRLAETIEHWHERDVPHVELVWECNNITFSLLALVLTVLEIARLAGETLTPFFVLGTEVIKMTLAGANLGLDGFVYARSREREYSIVGLGIDLGLMVVTMVMFVYAIRVYRWVARAEEYEFKRGLEDFELGHDLQIFAGAKNTEYRSQTQGLGETGLKSRIDRAVGAEFGWGSGVPSTGRVEKSGSFVGSKVVPSRTVRREQGPRRDSERASVVEEEDDDDDDDDTARGSHNGGRLVVEHRREGSEDDSRALLAELDSPGPR